MPVTPTATRALRSSKRKQTSNDKTMTELEMVLRSAKKSKTAKNVSRAMSLIDRAAKKNVIHKNKAARLKSKLTSKGK